MKKILIIGATSAIAEATARIFAADKNHLYLLARNTDRLTTIAKDLKIRGAEAVDYNTFDVSDGQSIDQVINEAVSRLEKIDIVLLAHGTLPDQKACEADFNLCAQELQINMISTIQILSKIANLLEKQGNGTIVAITSVAGDRGRQSNYVYGTAKGAISIFLQGLRNRLTKSNVDVINVKPGFVDTPMTADFDKGFLWAQPNDIAKGIVKAIAKRKHDVYLPSFWRLIMLIIKTIPEFVFKRLGL